VRRREPVPGSELMASVIRKLADEDVLAVHHMIRRDAHTDLEIAREVEKRLGRTIAPNDHARAMVVHRYRNSKTFQNWLTRWQNQDIELRRQLEAQKQRFELIGSLVRGGDERGVDTVSRALQARMLTLAAEANDEELKAAAGGKGWIANLLRIVQSQAKLEMQQAAEKAEEVAADASRSPEERRRAIREIFGEAA